MIWKKYKHVIIAFGGACILSFLLMFIVTKNFYFTSATKPLLIENKRENDDVVVMVQKYYTLCGHFVEVETKKYNSMEEVPLSELTERYPSKEGWIINKITGKIIFSLPVDKLCPLDEPKRHFRFKDGYIVVYQGPPDANGPLLRITSIQKHSLPENWKKKIENREILFNSERELLQALDTLDEYN